MKKKRKIDTVYLSWQWEDKDKYEITKVRQVICNHIFKYVKFVKGEGATPTHKRDNKTRRPKIWCMENVTKDLTSPD